MLMIYLVAGMSLVVISTIVLWGYSRYARLDLDRLAALEKWSDCYFKCATILVDEKTPTPLLEDILALNRSLDDPRAPRNLLKILKAIPADRIRADRHRTEIFEFLKSKNLTDTYREMATSYIFTISYKDRVRGPLIRKLLASAQEQDSEIPKYSEIIIEVLNWLKTREKGAHSPTPA
jgi:hypothetical protein